MYGCLMWRKKLVVLFTTGVIGILLIPQFGQCAGDEPRQFDTHFTDILYDGETLVCYKEKKP